MSSARRLPLLLLVAGLATPVASASAATFCVAPATCDTAPAATLQHALDDAASNAGDDTILLGAATYSAGAASFSSTDFSGGVAILGAGRDKTVVTNTAAASGAVLDVAGVSGVTHVRDLTVRATPGANHHGIVGGTGGLELERVDVLNPDQVIGNFTNNVLFANGAASARWVTGRSVAGGSGNALNVQGPNGVMRDLDLSGNVAVVNFGLGTLLDRLRISARSTGIRVGRSALVRDSVIRMTADNGVGIATETTSASPTASVTGLTLVGPGTSSTGAGLFNGASGFAATMEVENSIITGFQRAAARQGSPGAAANLTLTRSAYDAASIISTGTGTLTESFPLPATFGFVGGDDLHLRWDSPLVEAVGPNVTPWPDRLDNDGLARLVNGAMDVGAYEYQRRAPAVSASGPATLTAGQAGGFSATGTDPDPGDPLTYAWEFGDGTTSTDAAPSHAFARAGSFAWKVTVKDPTGQTASASGTTTVAAAPGGSTPPTPLPGTPTTTVPARPSLTKVSFRKRFRRTAKGLAFRFTLSRPSAVTVTIDRRRGKRWSRVGALPRKTLAAGRAKLSFSGRVKGKRLAPGRYRATLTATADGRASSAVRLAFTVTR
ncbi:PKD domain-containing protein [Conexibacter sp. SYSU D00693]|uniref:PKD domain-containing protein n=1 Tax=Conexibacter sp. SYSU D00693 TaxID=2812560 RepID=UPI00196AED30|nr:PKD domain-containing protein [Conexibacter sp. SYSU D00693]